MGSCHDLLAGNGQHGRKVCSEGRGAVRNALAQAQSGDVLGVPRGGPDGGSGSIAAQQCAYGFVTLRSWAKPRPFGRPRRYSDGILQAGRNLAVMIKAGVEVKDLDEKSAKLLIIMAGSLGIEPGTHALKGFNKLHLQVLT